MATVKDRQGKVVTQPRRGLSRGVMVAALVLLVLAGVGAFFHFHRNTPVDSSGETATTVAAQPDLPAPTLPKNHIYSETDDPHEAIRAALAQARSGHKRVLLDFGGDWCGDCQVLDLYFHEPPNNQLLSDKYVLVHVFIGRMDKNLDVPEQYEVPLKRGVPALAVLDERGKLLYSQQTGEFENMRHMDANSVTDFLNRWKG